jgi:hypothetical protein
VISTCQAGHNRHATVLVDTSQGPMTVYDWDRYCGFAGYCEGQDDVSRTIANTGGWEPDSTAEMRAILESGDRSRLFFDIGAHIGWYTKMALSLGYTVHAFEADAENIELLRVNAPGDVVVHPVWIDQDTAPVPRADIELVKIDIEGNEQYAIAMVARSLNAGTVRNIYMEVSPVFNGSYPVLITALEGWGFTAYRDGEPFDHDFNFDQTNLLFTA